MPRLALLLCVSVVLLLSLHSVSAEQDSVRFRSFRLRMNNDQKPKRKPSVKSHDRQPVAKADLCNGKKLFGSVTVSVDAEGKSHYTYRSACDVQSGVAADWVAKGVFLDKIFQTGWDELSLQTSNKFSDLQQAFAAGFLEGAMTHDKIWLISKYTNRNHAHSQVRDFFDKQDKFLRSQIANVKLPAHTKEDVYWYNVALVLAQLDGIVEGYNHMATSDKRLSRSQIWLMNSDGDVMDLERMFNHKPIDTMNRAELIEMISFTGRCSLLVKWTGTELLVGHTTWEDYAEMMRMFKHYDFAFTHPSIKNRRTSHSSYPGFVTSSDDFYILDSGLLVTETTINILNEQLYKLVDPSKTVVAWIRSLTANRMASTAKEWCDIFSEYNSGTYNDQWVVVDYNLYTKGQAELKPNTMWVLEQIPGFIEKQDMTHLLSKETYWASYNRPYFKSINEKSMYAKYANIHGEMLTYRDNPRAKIFERDHKTVVDENTMKKLMMQNKFQTDPLSLGCPGNAIAGRFDLPAPKCTMARVANGATDAKVTTSELVRKHGCHAIAGPTHDDQPPFTWDDPHWRSEKHEGMPTSWSFNWVTMYPQSI